MHPQKNRRLILLLMWLVLTTGIFLLIIQPSFGPRQNADGSITISGTVTRISNECNVNGICSVTLDNKKTIITGSGPTPQSPGYNKYDQSRLRIGQHIEATVIEFDPPTYTLQCPSCTIRP